MINSLQPFTTAFMRPIFSPRAEMSRYMDDIDKNKTSLIINIDKETLSLLKNQFEANDNKMDKITFVSICLKILTAWQKDLPYRQSRMIVYLTSLFDEIEDKVDNVFITWQQFNNLIIQKALNLKSLQSNDADSISQFKPVAWSKGKIKMQSPILKIVCINKSKKLAYLCEESNKIQFLNIVSNVHNFRALVLDRQDLMVQKSLIKRVKDQGNNVIKENYKKQVVVSGYTVTFLDMIYISSEKYEMLVTSSTDGLIRGWDINGTTPVLAKQPQNEQQKMVHQFPVQIHSMAWDQVNQILYCSAKNSKIYLWVVKTDSQKQLNDSEGHHSMISAMIMIPKLQFLATGDYDGKLILWDTISMNKKYKYQQHTRSIVSITFHEQLILLFTASFDHSICVWNPYIPSLIHKIACNVNVLQVHIIKGTNYLAALDMASNLKIREVKKFNLISTTVVDRPEEVQMKPEGQPNNQGFIKIQPACMGISEDPIRFYFGGHSIKCLQFDENQALASSDYYPTFLKYSQQKMKLYVVVKNSILIWDILTGQIHDVFQNQADQQITAISLIPNSNKFVIGDSQGSIYLRKLQNGIKISKIYTSRAKVQANHLICKIGGLWNQSVIISIFQDGQVVVFGKDQSHNFILLRNFNLRKHYPHALILAAQYEEKRNLLILGTHNGDIICMDVDKSRVSNHIQAHNFEPMKFVLKYQIPSLITFGKNGQIFGMYLPPHSKKFKSSCNILIQSAKPQLKIVSLVMSKLSDKCYLAYQNGIITQMLLTSNLINKESNNPSVSQQPQKIFEEWQIKLSQMPKEIILINREEVLAIILHMKNITLVSAQNGEILNVLPSYAIQESSSRFYDNPLCYYNNTSTNLLEKERDKQRQKDKQKQKDGNSIKKQTANHQIYLLETKKYYPINYTQKEGKKQEQLISKNMQSNSLNQKELQMKIFHNPYYLYEQYINIIKETQKKKQVKFSINDTNTNINSNSNAYNVHNVQKQNQSKKIVWNQHWKIFPQFRQSADRMIQEIETIKRQIQVQDEKPAKRLARNNSVSAIGNMKRIATVQRKWQELKDEFEDEATRKMNNAKLMTLSSFKVTPALTYNSSIRQGDQKMDNSLVAVKQLKDKEPRDSDKSVLITKHKSLHTSQSSPLMRLGLALQKVNQKDDKAAKFIQLAEKITTEAKKSLRLPKIRNK